MRAAEARFAALRLANLVTLFGDGGRGWVEQAPFDRIVVTAAAPEIPAILCDQLAVGGVMVLPVGADYRDQVLVRVRRGDAGYDTEQLERVRFVPLVAGLPRPGEHEIRSPDDLVTDDSAID